MIQTHKLGWRKRQGHWNLVCTEDVSAHTCLHTLGDIPERPPHEDGDFWGPWVWRKRYNVLVYTAQNYEIDLDSIMTREQKYSWIIHMANKVWVTQEALGHLVHAFRDLFRETD